MKKQSTFTVLVFQCLIATLLFLTNCHQISYTPQSLKSVLVPRQEKVNRVGIQVHIQLLSYKQTKNLLNNRQNQLFKFRGASNKRKQKIAPVIISFENNTNQTWVFKNTELLPFLTAQEMAELLFFSKSYAIFKDCCLATGLFLATNMLLIPYLLMTYEPITSTVIIPNATLIIGLGVKSIRSSITTNEANACILTDMNAKTLPNQLLIGPYAKIDKLFFIDPKKINNSLTIYLHLENYPHKQKFYNFTL